MTSFQLIQKLKLGETVTQEFYKNMQSISLRSNICREMIVNCLIHREFTSGRVSKFVIEKDRMYVENPNKAQIDGKLTEENFEPFPKNPSISKVFREITYSEELGSGFRKLNEYVPLYSGKNVHPEFIDGDMFKIIVPLYENYSDGEGINEGINNVFDFIRQNPGCRVPKISAELDIPEKTVERRIKKLKEENKIEYVGSNKTGGYRIKIEVGKY